MTVAPLGRKPGGRPCRRSVSIPGPIVAIGGPPPLVWLGAALVLSATAPALAQGTDPDGDGLPSAWETQFGLESRVRGRRRRRGRRSGRRRHHQRPGARRRHASARHHHPDLRRGRDRQLLRHPHRAVQRRPDHAGADAGPLPAIGRRRRAADADAAARRADHARSRDAGAARERGVLDDHRSRSPWWWPTARWRGTAATTAATPRPRPPGRR